MLQNKSKVYQIILGLVVVLGILATATAVQAHTRVELGPYVVIVGWLEEPVIVGERNAIVVEVTRNDVAVQGVESTLDLELIYAGQAFRANLNPTESPGVYTAELFPTVRGQYNVRLFGEIEALEVDEVITPEEVFPASRLQFPEAEPDVFELNSRLELLESQLNSARLTSYAGIAVGLIGTVLGALGVRKKPD